MATLQLGSKVKLTTSDKQEIRGTVWGADKEDHYVVLHAAGAAPGHACLHFVNRTAFAGTDGVEVLQPASQQPLPTLHTLCPQRTAERLEKALKAAEQEAARMGDGVSVLAQHMYDAINKTMPCSWDGLVIVVLDEVRVAPPYSPATCTTRNPKDTTTMQRVQKVLEMEAHRMAG